MLWFFKYPHWYWTHFHNEGEVLSKSVQVIICWVNMSLPPGWVHYRIQLPLHHHWRGSPPPRCSGGAVHTGVVSGISVQWLVVCWLDGVLLNLIIVWWGWRRGRVMVVEVVRVEVLWLFEWSPRLDSLSLNVSLCSAGGTFCGILLHWASLVDKYCDHCDDSHTDNQHY